MIVQSKTQLNHFDQRNKLAHICARWGTRPVLSFAAVPFVLKQKNISPFCRQKHIQPRSLFSFACCKVSPPFSEFREPNNSVERDANKKIPVFLAVKLPVIFLSGAITAFWAACTPYSENKLSDNYIV